MTRIYSQLPLHLLLVLIAPWPWLTHAIPDPNDIPLLGKRTASGGLHLPIQRTERPRSHPRAETRERRDSYGNTASIGLGDVADFTYNVLLTIGSVTTPVVLDTGSSDLWVLSSACTGLCTGGVPYYPMANFKPSGANVQLLYGDTFTGTRAAGPIGTEQVSLAGVGIGGQYFAAVNSTNTSIIQTGSAGIFGLGFPINSVIFEDVLKTTFPGSGLQRRRADLGSDLARLNFPKLPSLIQPSSSKRKRRLPNNRAYSRANFPTLPSQISSSSSSTPPPPPPSNSSSPSSSPPPQSTMALSTRQTNSSSPSTSATITDVLNGFNIYGPLTTRLSLASPQITITLQRNAISVGGNVGLLSLGELPDGVSNDSLTWSPIRGYTVAQGGLPAPPDSPNEIYPIAWEVPVQGVFLDGKQLPSSNLSTQPGIGVSALIDSGNSLIRGPQDVVSAILSSISTSPNGTFPCASAHTLAFQIGGQMFPIDPRDFITPDPEGQTETCLANLVPTDPPGTGFLYSWSLGDPWMKSNLVSFYYGNLTHPSVDPPRIGIFNTVPSNAPDLLQSAIQSAQQNGAGFPTLSVSAPAGVPTGQGYGVEKVAAQGSGTASEAASPAPQETQGAVPPSAGGDQNASGSGSGKSNSAAASSLWRSGRSTSLTLAVVIAFLLS